MEKKMVLGIPAGSLLEPALALLKKVGMDVVVNGRNFVAEVRGSSVFSKAIIMRPNDLPLAVKTGVIDVAITGNDMLLESCLEKELRKIAELRFSKKSRTAARIVIFGREDEPAGIIDTEDTLVSSEYMYLARTIFKNAKIQFSSGSTEIKVSMKEFGFRYGIGVVETGNSLKDNGLRVIKTILVSPAVLIARKEVIDFQILGQMLKGALEAEQFQLIR
jgi:ATP phosphoribosyltransferase